MENKIPSIELLLYINISYILIYLSVKFKIVCNQMQKKLQQLKAPKKKNLQASKLSVEGRGMVKYL